jgi:hypothetical protein
VEILIAARNPNILYSNSSYFAFIMRNDINFRVISDIKLINSGVFFTGLETGVISKSLTKR